jgi:hypothetical protein
LSYPRVYGAGDALGSIVIALHLGTDRSTRSDAAHEYKMMPVGIPFLHLFDEDFHWLSTVSKLTADRKECGAEARD